MVDTSWRDCKVAHPAVHLLGCLSTPVTTHSQGPTLSAQTTHTSSACACSKHFAASPLACYCALCVLLLHMRVPMHSLYELLSLYMRRRKAVSSPSCSCRWSPPRAASCCGGRCCTRPSAGRSGCCCWWARRAQWTHAFTTQAATPTMRTTARQQQQQQQVVVVGLAVVGQLRCSAAGWRPSCGLARLRGACSRSRAWCLGRRVGRCSSKELRWGASDCCCPPLQWSYDP